MTTATEAFAPAKINLTLHVTGQRSDGYHLLDSLVVFADIGDRLLLTPGPDMHIDVTGLFADGVPTDASNLVWKALKSAGWTGHVALHKNLPHGAGIGGGSADAAAVLRSIFGDDVHRGIGLENTLALGADVPVCLHTGPQRMHGIGEGLIRVRPVPRLHLVLVNPNVTLPTPNVFKALKHRSNSAMDHCDGWPSYDRFLDWLRQQRNDLEPPAQTVAPVIRDVLAALSDAALARMSGSGATCFGIYPDKITALVAQDRIAGTHPNWWVTTCETVGRA
ncbi:4-(cytidine 5'-diphospho)-2-C-methyl-D-erythritol kinase [Marivita sp. S0852]|uniref:4-(cytidine 5'-diphospho)-2-C-methyl-D-erythritol kinase n=1 Tax=Marivita sp. S0852 TaxID=3373893 RepID=UPI003982C2E6